MGAVVVMQFPTGHKMNSRLLFRCSKQTSRHLNKACFYLCSDYLSTHATPLAWNKTQPLRITFGIGSKKTIVSIWQCVVDDDDGDC